MLLRDFWDDRSGKQYILLLFMKKLPLDAVNAKLK